MKTENSKFRLHFSDSFLVTWGIGKLIILFAFFVLIGCNKQDKEQTNSLELNVVFYASGTGFKINGVFGTYIVSRDLAQPNPQCNSYWDAKSKYLIRYLKGGTYNVTIYGTKLGDVVFTLTVKEGFCNTFDVTNAYGWH